jgi:hypothetical protein
VLTTVHLTAVAVWIGALAHVVRTGATRHWSKAARRLLADYARHTLVWVVTVLVTGTLSALLLISPTELPDTDFNRVLAVASMWSCRRISATSTKGLSNNRERRPGPCVPHYRMAKYPGGVYCSRQAGGESRPSPLRPTRIDTLRKKP